MEIGSELLFILEAILGKYFLMIPLPIRGTIREITNSKIISNIGIENSVLYRIYTNVGNIKGTTSDVTITIPTTIDSLPPT
jgi:hypothetical protein